MKGPEIASCLLNLSGRIIKVVASDAEVALIYTMHVALREYCP